MFLRSVSVRHLAFKRSNPLNRTLSGDEQDCAGVNADVPPCSRTGFSERPSGRFYIHRCHGRTIGMGTTQTLGGEVDRGLAALALPSAHHLCTLEAELYHLLACS